MKKPLAIACALMLWGTLGAQTLKIHRGAVTVAVPAAEAGAMTYNAAENTLTVMGQSYTISEIDSITTDRAEVVPSSVEVTYDGKQAHVLVAANVSPQMEVKVNGAEVSVVAAPTLQQEVRYTLTGTSAEGSFFMDGEYKARVTLQNLNLVSRRGAAIDIANGKRIDIVLPAGTTSELTDSPGLQKACLFVNGHAEFSGAGTLVLRGKSHHAFASDEYTRIKPSFGTMKVLEAVGDGLHVKQFFKMQGGTLDISGTQGDGIDVSFTSNPLDSLNGKAFIEAGNIRLNVKTPDTKGLKVDSIGELTVSGGRIEAAVLGDGCKGISAGGDILIQEKTVVPTRIQMVVTGGVYMPGDPLLEAKTRGIRGKSNLTFDGGNISISVSGKKAKAIKIDGRYVYKSGSIDCRVDAAI